MFEGLNAIPWYGLHHAYGTAEEVPMWLRQLLSSDKEARDAAFYDLWGAICHQDHICSATPYAVPFLIELLEYPDTPDKSNILVVLADILMADRLAEKYWHGEFGAPDSLPFKDAQDAALAGMPVYRALLADENPATRIGAANTLSRCRDRAAEAIGYLFAALHTEREPVVRATVLGALWRVTPNSPEIRVFFADSMRAATSEIERFSAADALMVIAGQETPDDAVEIVFPVFVQPSETLREQSKRMPTGWTMTGRPDVAAQFALQKLGPARLKFAIPTLYQKIATAKYDWEATSLSKWLLSIVFEGEPPETPAPPRASATLTPEQREALEILLATDVLWGAYGNPELLAALKAYGLPETRADLATYLGKELPPAAPEAPEELEETEDTEESETPEAPDIYSSAGRPHMYRKRVEEIYPDLDLIYPIRGSIDASGPETYDSADIHNELLGMDERTYIFSFPCNDAGAVTLAHEETLLRALQDRLPLPIPNPIYSSRGASTPGIAFFGYDELLGKPLYQAMLESIDGEH